MADKGIATRRRQEHEATILELALQTRKWAIEKGCYRDAESNEILGHFVVGAPAKGSHKPSWTEEFEEDLATWAQVCDKMIELNIPICAESFNGHYIGARGEHGVKIGTGINNVFTRTETLRRYVDHIVSGGQWGYAEPWINGRLQSDLKDLDLPRLIGAMENLLLSGGVPVQHSFAQLMITAWTSTKKNDDEAA